MNKRNITIGAVSLIIAAILQAIFLYRYKSDWISLVLLIMYACLFLKCWHDEGFKQWIKRKIGKKWIKRIGFILLLVALSLLPQSFGQYLGHTLEFIAYVISFVGWLVGLFFIQIASENE